MTPLAIVVCCTKDEKYKKICPPQFLLLSRILGRNSGIYFGINLEKDI